MDGRMDGVTMSGPRDHARRHPPLTRASDADGGRVRNIWPPPACLSPRSTASVASPPPVASAHAETKEARFARPAHSVRPSSRVAVAYMSPTSDRQSWRHVYTTG